MNQSIEVNMLKPFDQLDSASRGAPCFEYPGKWLVYWSGKESQHNSFSEAYTAAKEYWNAGCSDKVSICWQASSNDPRIGEVWFTGFYQHGYFDTFGIYRS